MSACQKCGSQLSKTIAFCPSCGFRMPLASKVLPAIKPISFKAKIGLLTLGTFAALLAALLLSKLIAAALIAVSIFLNIRAALLIAKDSRLQKKTLTWSRLSLILILIGPVVYLLTASMRNNDCPNCGYQIPFVGEPCPKCLAAERLSKELPHGIISMPKLSVATGDSALPKEEPVQNVTPEPHQRLTNISQSLKDSKLRTFLAKAPSLIISSESNKGKRFRVNIGKTSIGRSPIDNDIVIPDETASRFHAFIEFIEGDFVLRDNSSTNGTFVVTNGIRQKTNSHTLSDGDIVEIGDTSMSFKQFKITEPRLIDNDQKIPSAN